MPELTEEEREWGLLAGDVREALAEAGLPMTGDLPVDLRVGVRVEVNADDGDASGVWVAWHTHPRLALAAAECVAQGRLDDPVITRKGDVMEAMQRALLDILTVSGFQASDPDHDYRPYELLVVSGPTKGP